MVQYCTILASSGSLKQAEMAEYGVVFLRVLYEFAELAQYKAIAIDHDVLAYCGCMLISFCQFMFSLVMCLLICVFGLLLA